jgi:hypothetical protein
VKATRYAGADLSFKLGEASALMANLRTFVGGVQLQFADASRETLAFSGPGEELAKALEQIAAEIRALSKVQP